MAICSLIVQAKPENIDSVNQVLISMESVEVHAQNEIGKIVVTIDNPSREFCSKAMTDMTRIDGVMSTSLVYEYQEDLDAKQQQEQKRKQQKVVALN